jgi:hypothetical protein
MERGPWTFGLYIHNVIHTLLRQALQVCGDVRVFSKLPGATFSHWTPFSSEGREILVTGLLSILLRFIYCLLQ